MATGIRLKSSDRRLIGAWTIRGVRGTAFLILMCLHAAGAARAECCTYSVVMDPPDPVEPAGDCCSCSGKHTPKMTVLDCTPRIVQTCCGDEIIYKDTPFVYKVRKDLVFPPCDPDATQYTIRYSVTVKCGSQIFDPVVFDKEYFRDCGDGRGCPSCDAGAVGTDGASLPTGTALPSHTFRLGMSTQGETTGFLRMEVATNASGTVQMGQINPVVQAVEADIVYDPSDPLRLRQVMAAECLVMIGTNATDICQISYYHPNQVEAELDANGLYQTVSNAVPFAVYAVRHSGSSLEVVGGRTGSSDQTLYTPGPAAQPWTLQRGSAVRSIAFSDVGGTQVETRTLATTGGQTLRTVRKTRAPVYGALRLISRAEGPVGAADETRWYYTSTGQLEREERPDGSWTRYRRADGRLVATVEPLGDLSPGVSDTLCRVVSNEYATVDALDKNAVDWMTEPRTIATYEAGVAVSRTYYAYYRTSGGESVAIEERAATPSAPYGSSSNLRTKRTFYAEDNTKPWSGELHFAESTGGLLESHVYEMGSFDATGPDPADWSFTPDPAGLFVRATADFGTTNAPGGIAFRTRREVSIRDAFDRPLLDETWICTGDSSYTRVAWTATTRDALGRATAVRRSDGTLAETTWSCCGPESETAADGTVTETAYDIDKQAVLTLREGVSGGQWPAQPDLFTTNVYNAAGDLLASSTLAGGLSRATSRSYNLLGRVTNSIDAAGIKTTYSYGSNSTTTVRGGLTNTTVRFADGRAHYTEQNGIRQQTHAYGVSSDGAQWTLTAQGVLPDPLQTTLELPSFSTLELLDFPWEIGITDPLGRAVAQIRPGYGGALLVTSNFYDTANHLVRTSTLCASAPLRSTIFTYDELGNPLLTCQDLDLDGQIDLAGPDRVTGQAARHVELSGDWYEESASWTYPESGSDAPLTNAIARTRLTGLGGTYSADGASGLLTAESVSIDARGNQTVSRTVTDRDNKTVYQVTDTPDSSVAALTVTVNGLVQSSRSTHDLATTYAYDALGR